jgi:hypothetical protein
VSKRILTIVACAFFFSTSTLAQGNFQPRSSDEAYAWRLHDQYVISEKKERDLEAAIRLKAIEAGAPGTAQNDQAALELNRLFQAFTDEIQLQQRLEHAWNEKFYARYGDLRDSGQGIYDSQLETSLDRIQFRLIHFAFYRNDGTYNGTIADVPGEIALTVEGTAVVGTITGAYFYRVGKLIQSEQFSGSVDGTIDQAGNVKANLSGSVGRFAFAGSLVGKITRGVASGTWAIDAVTVQCGTFKATRDNKLYPR